MRIVPPPVSCLHSVGNRKEETMAKPEKESPLEKYNREIKILWEKAKNMSTLPLPELIETLVAFSARIVGVCYNPNHQKDSDSEYSNQAGNRMLLKLKEELAMRYKRLAEARSKDSLVVS